MTRLLTAFAISFTLITIGTGSAFAATPVAEPSLPADITSSWEEKSIMCNDYVGKLLFQVDYNQRTVDSVKEIRILMLNGQKVLQSEMTRAQRSDSISLVQYVRNSSEKNWSAYTKDEIGATYTRFLSEIGLTSEQFVSCIWR